MFNTKIILTRTFCTVLLIAAIPASVMYSQRHSDHPIPSGFDRRSDEKPEPRADNKNAKPAKHGTRTNPIFIQVPAGSNQDKAAEKYATQEENYASSEWWLAYLTIAIVAFTGGLMVFTALLWSATINLMKASEDSTKAIERAYIFLERITAKLSRGVSTNRDTLPHGGSRHMEIVFALRNHGKTPAIITDVLADLNFSVNFFSVKDAPPTNYGSRVTSAPDFEEFEFGERELLMDEIEAARTTGKPMLLFHGIVHYKIFNKELRWTKFCWIYDFKNDAFHMADAAELNDWS